MKAELLVLVLLAGGSLVARAPAQESATNSFRTVRGKHLVLKADDTPLPRMNEFVAAFDAAVPQWEAFLGLSRGTLDRWSVDGFLMAEEQRFRDSGDLPAHMDFPYGYAMAGNIWAKQQESDYYTRHLLLHEGVHALAVHLYGGTGPSWFAEGMAEMLGVHRGVGEQVQVNAVPADRESVPYWGRFKLMSQRRREAKIPTLDAVLDYPPDLKSDVESYGWSWAAVMLFAEYADCRPVLLEAGESGMDRTLVFTTAFQRRLQANWPLIQARWRMLTNTMDYGFQWDRERIEIDMSDPVWDRTAVEIDVDASRGWQSSGMRFAPGSRVSIQASGRCTVAQDPKPWISEPPGVTIEYAEERPVGQLLVAVLPNATRERETLEKLRVASVAPSTQFEIPEHCWLLFRVNDHLNGRGDNSGGYRVRIEISP